MFYYPGITPHVTTTWQIAQWKATGLDSSSVVADPLFVNLGADDFRLSPSSPALGLGFVQSDMSDVGPRPRP